MIGLEVWKYRNSCVETQFLDFLVTRVKEQFVIVPPVLDVGRRLTPMVAWERRLLCFVSPLGGLFGSIFDMGEPLKVRVREGCRGGQEQFKWNSLREQEFKDRECYLRQSTKVGMIGKFGYNSKHDWYAKKKGFSRVHKV